VVLSDDWRGDCGWATVVVVFLSRVRAVWLVGPAPGRGDFKLDPVSVVLTLGKRGLLFGSVWFDVAGGPDAQRLVLKFPIRSVSGEQLAPVRQIICCYWRTPHYGRRYLMFLCSECSRSARVLYARYFRAPTLSRRAKTIRKIIERARKACERYPCEPCKDRRCPAIVWAFWPDIISKA
jgi:hypothetical protein